MYSCEVSSKVAVTVAPAMTAPFWSVTWPEMPPLPPGRGGSFAVDMARMSLLLISVSTRLNSATLKAASGLFWGP